MTDPLSSLLALAQAEPPPRQTVPHPDWAPWQALMVQKQQAYDAARANAIAPEDAVTRAQTELDNFLRDQPAPPKTVREPGGGRPAPNPDYEVWLAARQVLIDARDAEVASALPYRQAVERAYGDLINTTGAQPPTTIEVDNPAYATWVQQTSIARAALKTARWDQLFDAEVAALRATATSARAAWQQALENVDRLARRLTEQRQLEGPLATQVAGLAAAVQSAQQEASTTAAAFQTALDQESALLAQEPPPRQTVPHPDWAPWQALMVQKQQAYDAARANAAAPEDAVTRAQTELDNFLRDQPAPPKTVREPGGGRPAPNPDYEVWLAARQVLIDARDAEVASALPYRQAVERAYGDLINTTGAQPPTTMEVDNPAHTTWRQEMDQLGLAVGNARVRAKRGADALAAAQAALAGSQAELAQVRALLATLPGELAAAQAGIAGLAATRDGTAAELAAAEQQIAVLLDHPAADEAIVGTLQELFQRWSQAEAGLRVFEDEMAPADEELWRLQARVGELGRAAAQAAANTQNVQSAEQNYLSKVTAVNTLLSNRPRP